MGKYFLGQLNATMEWRAVCIHIAIACMYLRSSHGSQPWSVLPEITEEVCPNTCIWKTLNKTANNTYCCKDCSCDDNCGVENNCCFEELDKRNEDLKSMKTCTRTDTRDSSYDVPAYYMIEHNPINGCSFAVDGMKKGEQCGSMNAASWGSLYPVISSNTGNIYRNKHCAICHNDTNYSTWFPVKVCRSVRGNNFISNSLEFEDGTEKYPDNCYVSFQITGYDVDLGKSQCLLNPIDYCKYPSFRVPNGLNITRDEVRDACKSGFRSEMGIYANIFCWMCSSGLEIRKPLCYHDFTNRFSRNSILILIDPETLSRASAEVKEGRSFRRACIKSRERDLDSCVRLFCPTGQIWTGNGCEFLATTWAQGSFRVIVKLQLIEESDLPNTSRDQVLSYLIRSHITTIKASFVSPWAKRWVIKAIYYYKAFENSSSLEFLQIKLALDKDIEPEKLINEIDKSLNSGSWQLNIGPKSFRFSQEFANIRAYQNGYFERVYVSSRNQYRTPFQITKLFFCDQIELQNYEYVIAPGENSIYYNTTQRYFYQYEFKLLVSNIKPRAMICMSDSIYTISSSSVGSIYSHTCYFALAVFHMVFIAKC